MAFTDEMINTFLELAQEVGITKAKRELGYPKSWSTAQRWAELRGVNVNVDEIRQKAAVTREWYKTEEVVIVAQEGFNRIYEELVSNENLSADDQKKLADALKKHYEVWASAQGKATAISESRTTDSNLDAHLQDLINSEKAKNALRKTESITETTES